MNFFGIGEHELLIIALLAIIMLGPQRLAKVARKTGKLVRDLKAYFSALTDELNSELEILDELNEIKRDLNKR